LHNSAYEPESGRSLKDVSLQTIVATGVREASWVLSTNGAHVLLDMNAVLCRLRTRCLALVEPAVELDDDAIRIVHIEAAHPALGIGKRFPWAGKLSAFLQQFF
jgi:hypothetical protein